MKENNDFLNQTGSGEIEELKNHKEKTKKAIAEKHVAHIIKQDNIEQALAKGNVTQKILAEIKAFRSLKVKDTEDKEGYTKVKEALTICRNTRLAGEDICDAESEEARSYHKKCVAKKKEISEEIKETETILKEQKDIIDKEKARINEAREKEQEVRMKERITKLLSFGMVYDGETYSLKEGDEVLSLSSLDLKLSDDQAFNIFQVRAEILHQKSIIRIEAEQAAAKEEADRVARIAAEQKVKEEEIARQTAELKKAQDELLAAQAKIKADAEKAEAVEKAKKEAEEKAVRDQEAALKKAEADKQAALKAAEEKRLADIAALEKANADKLAAEKKAEEDRKNAEIKQKQDEEAAAKAEHERLVREEALKPERERIIKFAHGLAQIHFPEVTSKEGQEVVIKLKEAMQKVVAYSITQAQTLK